MANPQAANTDTSLALPESGLELVRSSTEPNYFDAAGHRAVVIGQEGGPYEVWTYPFKALSALEFFITAHGQECRLADLLRSFRVRPEASTAFFSADGLDIELSVLAPLDLPAAIFIFNIKCAHPVSLRAEASSDLKLMWPADPFEQNPQSDTDHASGARLTSSTATGDAVACGWLNGQAQAAPGESSHTLVYAVAASETGTEDALALWRECCGSWPAFYSGASDYYRQLVTSSARIETSDAQLDRAFQWAIIGTDKCFMRTPGVGSGFVAGFNTSNGGGRPGFGWYFGRDSSWTGYAVNDYGDFAKVADNIRLLARYQIADGLDEGKIFHELSAAHERQPGMNYAYPAADATPFFVIDVANYYSWTGDLSLVREMWPYVQKAIAWCYRMDVDADLLVDNPPAGHQWYDGGEKNMIDMVAIWCKGLYSAADLADALGDLEGARWRSDAHKVEQIINHDFWNETNSYLFDRKLPDGSMLGITTANPTVPLLWRLVEPEKASRAVRRMMREDLSVPWGMRTNSNLDSIYSTDGYHEGTVWPLTTGWASLAAFANGFPEAGWRHLKAVASLTEDFCLGYITEVLLGDRREPGGCPHQAWSEAMVVLPVVEGIFGVKPDAPQKALTIEPQLPEALDHAALRNLRVGDARIDIETRRLGSGIQVSVFSDAPGFSLVMAPFVPEGCTAVRLSVNRRVLPEDAYECVELGGPSKVVWRGTLDGRVDLELIWDKKNV